MKTKSYHKEAKIQGEIDNPTMLTNSEVKKEARAQSGT